MTCAEAATTWGGGAVSDSRSRTALITGIRGQDGRYLAELLIAQGYTVVGTSHRQNAVSPIDVSGMQVPVIYLDLSDLRSIQQTLDHFQPNEIYNLASRSSSSQLFDDAIATATINGLSVVGLLESIRFVCPEARFCQASSSEVFGKAVESPQDENTPLRPRNAYGAAKVFAQNMVETYRDRYEVFACSAILYNHESPLRGMEYVTRKITATAAQISAGKETAITLGNLESRRDWGFAGDYVDAMWRMLQQSSPEDFVIATGETHSVREFCELAFSRVGLDYRNHVTIDPQLMRSPDVVELCGNPSKARTKLSWRSRVTFKELVHMMVDADHSVLTTEGAVEEKQRGPNV